MSEPISTLTMPSAREALELLASALDPGDDRMVTIVGRCTVKYDGRASSSLGLGDRLVILKPDGSLLVHTDEQRTPVNWQPPGCTHDASLRTIENEQHTAEHHLHVHSVRRTPAETIDIRFTEVMQVSVFELIDESELRLEGTEEDLRQQILADPETLEEGFTPLATERETPAGAVDIYGKDAEGTPTVVELKRRRVGPDAVSQLKRYVTALERDLPVGTTVRGLLVTPSLTDRAQRLLAEEGLEYISLAPETNATTESSPTSLTDFEPNSQ